MLDKNRYPMPTSATVRSLEGLLYFVWEREAVHLAKRSNTPRELWTQDPVLKKYKFTNIRRRDDRITQWIETNIIRPNLSDHDLWFSLLIARLINWPPTLQVLLTEEVIPCAPGYFDADEFVDVVEHLKRSSAKVYGGAYMVYPTKMDKGGCKSAAISKYIIGSAVQHAPYISKAVHDVRRIETTVDALSHCFGISTFMAGQVAADLSYAPGHLSSASDLYTFAPIGPGSSRGLNYLTHRKSFASWKQDDFNEQLRDINERIKNRLLIDDLTLHDVQNVMCEYSKYCRVVLGEGAPKTIYKPETEF